MPTRDAQQIKEKIVSFIRIRGPTLPVHIAKETNLSILFASAFLSELYAEKRLKMSYMRVGTSPLYYYPEQEEKLERFAEHLKSKEKEAYFLLKEKKFLIDLNQEPAIRVALRAIKDFAIPFEHDDKLIWRYFITNQNEFSPQEKKEEIVSEKKEDLEKTDQKEMKIEVIKEEIIDSNKELLPPVEEKNEEAHQKTEETIQKKKIKSTKKVKKQTVKKPQKKENKFFDKIKEHLEKKDVEIIGVEGIAKTELILKIKEGKTEKLLFAFNKKKITDLDVLKAHKKSISLEMPYKILSLGESPKKLSELIEAVKSLEKIEKIE